MRMHHWVFAMKKTTIGITTLGGLILGVMVVCYLYGYLHFNYPDRSAFPMKGIDISHHQGQIDWERLQHEELAFVYIKATEGGDFQDPAFIRNWNDSRRAGFTRGAYHFFTFCKEGKQQALNFIQMVPQESFTLPPMIDFEYAGNCKARPPKDLLLNELRSYIAEIESVYKKSPIVYTTYQAYEDYLQGEIADYHLWIRNIFGAPTLKDGKAWTFWQYADNGRLNGIKGPVDLNVFNGSRDTFYHWCPVIS